MIQGYPARASVAAGETLTLHVSTDSARFRVLFYRWAEGFVPMHETWWLAGKHAEPGRAQDDWDWPAYSISIPDDWPSAVYIAYLQDAQSPALDLAMTSAAALIVVRGRRPTNDGARRGLLYKIPLATYHAYNCSGGGCFYVNPPRSDNPPGAKLSLKRPGGGIGGDTWGALDAYDLHSPRQTFAHWDAPFIRWLLRNGYQPEFCTDLDLHADPELCARYRLLVSVGHDEYWSEATRERVEQFIASGGNAAFFGANLCWWRIHIIDDGAAMVCHQGGPRGALDHWWPRTGVHRPEDALSGVSYRHGGGWWDGLRETQGYLVQDPAHWVFAGTGLGRGEAFGHGTSPPLVGYECDGAPLESFDPATGCAVLARDAQAAGTPAGFQLLAVGPLGSDWQELPPRENHAAGQGMHAAAMGMYARNGIVFTAGTTDWAQVLASGREPHVDTITRNVLKHLLD